MIFKEFKEKAHAPKKSKILGDRFYRLERNISVRISWILLKIFPEIKPNFITFISFLLLLIVLIITFIPRFQGIIYITIIQLILLYCITITDKIDGEIARAKDYFTQKGIYYDYTVHFFYPFVFYFVIANYFYKISNNQILFFLIIILSIFTMALILLRSTKAVVCQILKSNNSNIRDLILESDKKKKRLVLPLRILNYLTFMIYSWTLFYYIVLIIISLYNWNLAYILCYIHVIYSLLVISYKVLWSYPRNKLFKAN
jgi:phosphatidylglycerophosphate synthase